MRMIVKLNMDLDKMILLNIELEHRVTKLVAENEHLKQTYKQLYDSIKPKRVQSKEQCDALIKQVNIKSGEYFCFKCKLQKQSLPLGVRLYLPSASGSCILRQYRKDKIQQTPSSNSKNKVEAHPRNVKSSLNKRNGTVKVNGSASVQNSKKHDNSNYVVQIVLWYLDSGCSKHMTGDRSQLTNFISKFLGTVKFGNDQVAKIMGYGDYQIGNVTILRVYYIEGLGHNLFSVGQFCDSNLEVAFRQHTCFIRNLEGVDLLTGSRGDNLYTLSLGNMMASSPICLLSKASKTKSWLWHRRLSHLNFGAINHLARHGLVRVDTDAPSPCNIIQHKKLKLRSFSFNVKKIIHDNKVAHMGNGSSLVSNSKVRFDQSSSSDVIHIIVPPDHQVSEHNSKWTKDHSIENIIGDLDRQFPHDYNSMNKPYLLL
ncbi:retrovirus-related pol polyprotein from transposon TNT 1-94 [Tanacetum coccineum]|uniref:Retrovirus-related pol polyprotein from transposon TNT 1-94 n=1 Tax=Tanacetum coccineum TaxID=301880 RepID=A0ABQ5CH68_9ASTR